MICLKIANKLFIKVLNTNGQKEALFLFTDLISITKQHVSLIHFC